MSLALNFFERSGKEKVNPEIWKGAIESGKRVLAAIALCVHGMSRHNADERQCGNSSHAIPQPTATTMNHLEKQVHFGLFFFVRRR